MKQKVRDTEPGDGTSHEETAESRSERYRKPVETLRDCMLE